MFCSNCGSQVNDNDEFCGKCGHLLGQQATSPGFNEQTAKEAPEETFEDKTVFLGTPVQEVKSSYTSSNIPNQQPEHGSYYNEEYRRPPEYNAPSYIQPTAPKKKSRSPQIAILIVLIIVLAGIGFGGYRIYKSTRPEAPIENMIAAIEKSDWEKLYDNIYWGNNSSDYMTRDDFANSMQNYMSEGMTAMMDIADMRFIIESIGEEEFDDNLNIVREVTLRVQVLGLQTGTEEVYIQVVKSDEKVFFFFPKWKILIDSAGGFF